MSKKYDVIDDIMQVLKSCKKIDPAESYTAYLYDKGREKIAQKIGEEAVEVAIEATRKKKKNVTDESADLLFHLMVLWAEMGIKPADVIDTLIQNFGMEEGRPPQYKKDRELP